MKYSLLRFYFALPCFGSLCLALLQNDEKKKTSKENKKIAHFWIISNSIQRFTVFFRPKFVFYSELVALLSKANLDVIFCLQKKKSFASSSPPSPTHTKTHTHTWGHWIFRAKINEEKQKKRAIWKECKSNQNKERWFFAGQSQIKCSAITQKENNRNKIKFSIWKSRFREKEKKTHCNKQGNAYLVFIFILCISFLPKKRCYNCKIIEMEQSKENMFLPPPLSSHTLQWNTANQSHLSWCSHFVPRIF